MKIVLDSEKWFGEVTVWGREQKRERHRESQKERVQKRESKSLEEI